MTFIEFSKKRETLYGQITVNGKSKLGQFKPVWNKHSNQLDYLYHTVNGNKGTGGFTFKKAFRLFIEGKLSNNPDFLNDFL